MDKSEQGLKPAGMETGIEEQPNNIKLKKILTIVSIAMVFLSMVISISQAVWSSSINAILAESLILFAINLGLAAAVLALINVFLKRKQQIKKKIIDILIINIGVIAVLFAVIALVLSRIHL